MANFKRAYTEERDSVQAWDIVKETDEYVYLIPINSVVKKKKDTIFLQKKEAQYELFKTRITKGAKIENYKSSKYFDYYWERASVEDPELLI